MPFLAALAPLFTLASAGIGLGSSIYGAVSQPGQPDQPAAPPPPTAAQNVAAEVAKRGQDALITRQQQPGLQSNTSGSLSDQSYQTESSSAAGLPGEFGSGGFDLNSILKLIGAGGSGGSGNPTDLMALATGAGGGSIT